MAAFGGHGLFSTAADYARFCEMLLGGGELGGARILAPRTVAMWRTNHLQADALKTVRMGTGWGLGPQVVMDAAAAGEPYSDGSANWWGIGGTWFWIDPEKDFAFIGMIQHSGRSLLGVTQIHGYSRNLVYQTHPRLTGHGLRSATRDGADWGQAPFSSGPDCRADSSTPVGVAVSADGGSSPAGRRGPGSGRRRGTTAACRRRRAGWPALGSR